MELPKNPEIGDKIQMEDAHFWRIYGKYGWEYKAIDKHAIYGYLNMGDRGNEEFNISHRNALREPETAILCCDKGDRVRINNKNWMVVNKSTSEGFKAKYENGEKEYDIWWNYTPKRIDIETGPRIFSTNPWASMGEIHCIEVIWNE